MIYFTGLILIVLLNAFFSGCEIGLISSQKPRIVNQAKKGSKRAALIEFFLNHPNLMLSTILVGNNTCTVCASLLAEQTAVTWGFGSNTGILVTSIILTLILLASEIIPKDWFRQAPEERCIFFAPLLYSMYILLYVPSKLMAMFTRTTVRLFSPKGSKQDNTSLLLREDFRLLIRDSERANVIDSESADILDRSLDFYNLRIKDILTPMDKVVSISARATIIEAAKLCKKHNVSRLPVLSRRNNSDNPEWIGVFSVYNAIFNIDQADWNTTRVSGCMSSIYSVREDQEIPAVMSNSQAVKCRLLAVKDKEGRPIGVVTPIDVSKMLFS
jgi:CBS domain containing-hemolysin-like protein